MNARNVIVILVLAMMIRLPLVHANPDAYVIPLEGSRWTISTIPVYVSGGKDWQQNQTLQALQIWNSAQLWFARTYFPNSSVYTFEEGDSSAPVQVTLLNASAVYGTIQGWTDYHAKNGVMQSAKVKIAMNSQHAVLVLSLHELGHVLGLGHVSCCEKDVMNAFPVTNNVSDSPSTLDLYALHELATADFIPTFVWLQYNIPYQTDGSFPTPEFNDYSMIAAICVIGATFCFRRRRPV